VSDQAMYDPAAQWFEFEGARWPNDDERWRRKFDAVHVCDYPFSTDEVDAMGAHLAWLDARQAWRSTQGR